MERGSIMGCYFGGPKRSPTSISSPRQIFDRVLSVTFTSPASSFCQCLQLSPVASAAFSWVSPRLALNSRRFDAKSFFRASKECEDDMKEEYWVAYQSNTPLVACESPGYHRSTGDHLQRKGGNEPYSISSGFVMQSQSIVQK